MTSTTIRRGLSISFVLLIGLPASRSEAMGDPWPLVNAADRAVWGTLIHTSGGTDCRLLVVLPDVAPPATGAPPVRIADTIVGLPEGTAVVRGQPGLFLVKNSVPEGTGIPALEGTILVGGYLPGRPSSEVRAAVERAAAGPAADPPFSEEDALVLLGSEWGPARAMALGWWRDRGAIGPDAKSALDASLATDDAEWLRAAFETFLLHGWPLPTSGLAPLVSGEEDPVLVDLAVHAIRTHGDADTRANLLLEWNSTSTDGRIRLLGAYASLELTESLPWWQDALASDDPRLWSAALRELGRSKLPGALDAYRAVLRSENRKVLGLAIDGLARTRTAEAAQILREFRETLDEDDPLAERTARLLGEPGRHREHPRARNSRVGDGR